MGKLRNEFRNLMTSKKKTEICMEYSLVIFFRLMIPSGKKEIHGLINFSLSSSDQN